MVPWFKYGIMVKVVKIINEPVVKRTEKNLASLEIIGGVVYSTDKIAWGPPDRKSEITRGPLQTSRSRIPLNFDRPLLMHICFKPERDVLHALLILLNKFKGIHNRNLIKLRLSIRTVWPTVSSRIRPKHSQKNWNQIELSDHGSEVITKQRFRTKSTRTDFEMIMLAMKCRPWHELAWNEVSYLPGILKQAVLESIK